MFCTKLLSDACEACLTYYCYYYHYSIVCCYYYYSIVLLISYLREGTLVVVKVIQFST